MINPINFIFVLEINECEENLDDCDANAICTNVAGSFVCACLAGYEGDGKNCTSKFYCLQNGYILLYD